MPAAGPHELGERDRAILDFERDWPLHQGGKRDAIKERFAISAARYYQLLAAAVDKDAALAYDPLTVRRIRRRRQDRDRRGATAVGGQPSR